MEFKTLAPPYVRTTSTSAKLSRNVLIALLPLTVLSFVYYGPRPVIIMLLSIVTAVLCETFACLLMKCKITISDGSAAVTGGIIGALLSPIAPYWMPILGSAFAIIIAKMPMGGYGRNIFNPAAAGMSFLTLCFPAFVFSYPLSGSTALTLGGTTKTAVNQGVESFALLLRKKEAYPTADKFELLLGDFAGPIGATAIAVLIAVYLYLLATRSATLTITVPYIATCVIFALIAPRTTEGLNSVLIELSSGYLLFAGIFLLSDPVTAPRFWVARVLYGILAGMLVMLLRHFGKFEESACFAIMLVNVISPAMDRLCWYAVNFRRKAKQRMV